MTGNLRGLDDIFGKMDDGGEKVRSIKLADLDFFPQHTRMYADEDLRALAEDIAENGVQEPILVRSMQEDAEHAYPWYQVLNGRNRTAASRLAGVEDIPALVREADDATAAYIVATTTLNQRQELLPSEKAFAYQMKLEATKRKAGRPTKGNSPQFAANFRSDDEVAKTANISGDTLRRYIRLTQLIPPLLQLVDDGTLLLGIGSALSYLSESDQETVDAFLREHNKKISLEQAENLKRFSQSFGAITHQQLQQMFLPEQCGKVVTREATSIKFKRPVLKLVWSYIPDEVDEEDVTDYILRALEFYKDNTE